MLWVFSSHQCCLSLTGTYSHATQWPTLSCIFIWWHICLSLTYPYFAVGFFYYHTTGERCGLPVGGEMFAEVEKEPVFAALHLISLWLVLFLPCSISRLVFLLKDDCKQSFYCTYVTSFHQLEQLQLSFLCSAVCVWVCVVCERRPHRPQKWKHRKRKRQKAALLLMPAHTVKSLMLSCSETNR